MAADITDDRALGGNLRLIRSTRQRLLARANVVDRMSGSQCLRLLAMDPRTRGIKRVEIIRMYPKGTGPNWPTARLIRCRRERCVYRKPYLS